MIEEKNKILSFYDLEVYQRSYDACIILSKKILPLLPVSEKFDLSNQLSRSSKAIPRLITEGFAKKHQKKGFQKYLDDALAESNETQVGLNQARDLYNVEYSTESGNDLSQEYKIISKQIFRLKETWNKFS